MTTVNKITDEESTQDVRGCMESVIGNNKEQNRMNSDVDIVML
jgi:hypothetical protein